MTLHTALSYNGLSQHGAIDEWASGLGCSKLPLLPISVVITRLFLKALFTGRCWSGSPLLQVERSLWGLLRQHSWQDILLNKEHVGICASVVLGVTNACSTIVA